MLFSFNHQSIAMKAAFPSLLAALSSLSYASAQATCNPQFWSVGHDFKNMQYSHVNGTSPADWYVYVTREKHYLHGAPARRAPPAMHPPSLQAMPPLPPPPSARLVPPHLRTTHTSLTLFFPRPLHLLPARLLALSLHLPPLSYKLRQVRQVHGQNDWAVQVLHV